MAGKGELVGGSPANSIATKQGGKMPGLGKHKHAQTGKKAGYAHGPKGKKL